ncbi:MAG: cytochrome c biogenesis protein CcsA [bacterium]|nr:MAG: cytochrome c biogenesis protein CcsA [bacterium]
MGIAMKKTLDIFFPAAALAAVISALAAVFLYAPVERTMGLVQKIFYFHLGSAAAAFLAFTVVLVSSVFYLVSRSPRWDTVALAAAETGVLFCTLVLITGPLWARPVWGKWWVWDPRLTTTLILWFLYVGYMVIREALPGPRGALAAGVFGILAYVDVPIVYFSIRWWRGIHPVVIRGGNVGLDAGMIPPLIISLAAFVLLLAALTRERYNIGNLELRIQQLEVSSKEDTP